MTLSAKNDQAHPTPVDYLFNGLQGSFSFNPYSQNPLPPYSFNQLGTRDFLTRFISPTRESSSIALYLQLIAGTCPQGPQRWKVKLDRLRHESNVAFATEDFTFFSRLKSNLYSNPSTGLMEVALKIPDEVQSHIRKETAYACETVNASYGKFSKEAEALKQDPAKDGNVWRAKLADLKGRAIDVAKRNMGTSFDNIEKKIESLPLSQREVAVDMFAMYWTRFIEFGIFVWRWMGNLVDAVGQFVMGVCGKIKTGQVHVKAAFETRMKFIMGGLGARHLP